MESYQLEQNREAKQDQQKDLLLLELADLISLRLGELEGRINDVSLGAALGDVHVSRCGGGFYVRLVMSIAHRAAEWSSLQMQTAVPRSLLSIAPLLHWSCT